MVLCISRREVFLESVDSCLKRYEVEARQFKIRRRDDCAQEIDIGERSSGEERFRRFRWLIENAFWKPALFQQEFISQSIQVLAELVVGPEDWPQLGPILIAENDWDMSRNNKMLLGMAPRRWGKSIVLAMIIAAALLVIPKLTAAVFATGQRISSGMGHYIREALEMSGNAHLIIRQNEELIEIRGDTPGDTRTVNCYPATAQISFRKKQKKTKKEKKNPHFLFWNHRSFLFLSLFLVSSFPLLFLIFQKKKGGGKEEIGKKGQKK
jgi:hypothetical protein